MPGSGVGRVIGQDRWILRHDLATARRFLRYALLAARGRVVLLDERLVEDRGGYAYRQLTIAALPLRPRRGGDDDPGADQPPASR